jgi:hypothetical protein
MKKFLDLVAWVFGFVGFVIIWGSLDNETATFFDLLKQIGLGAVLMLIGAWIHMREKPAEEQGTEQQEAEEMWNVR